mgnify:CR=1 FL=1
MKNFIKNILIKFLNINLSINQLDQLLVWQNHNNFSEPFPQFIKEKVFQEYNLDNSIWIETGTYKGDSAAFLSTISAFVYSIEPSEKYFNLSSKNLKGIKNIELINDVSVNGIKTILDSLDNRRNVCFWLDGHYSGADTYKGKEDTPVMKELDLISNYFHKFRNFSILIDDFRLFDSYKKNQREKYPDKSELINWAQKKNLKWSISRDIFLIYN